MGAAGDLALLMVEQGAAVAKPGAPPAYLEAQKATKDSRLGLWRGDFVPFPNWRAGERLDVERSQKTPCPVKGVVEDDGRKVYLVPTDAVYPKVTVTPEAGGRLFCSDEEARTAGFERPGEG